ncbi:hypothetical protein FGSG_12576 [Fusarium graminearum PH-1]|uniref:Chromosome 2, complete genome n=1 Tax=Gibberella zeae (strain ATCC MYA-4620 / CBS 123657 / FGSC 9075 / NRRL 31084 / PH-1) TaxID=229533 RepID=I1S6V3_GIBZE|nr:hypothetical protein FGSG_12576 [Fusarium graminearum PH-1]ESU10510.1 hypothetical protein FGSG_12576 [Fusarium graminearum PH-1]CEF77478.1 unnamed protein product [Fusarium graminearum]|eukprot:XP_011323009.1 hypothetical protein FGSG_12576 [Fusarium graminearum PH-1]
MNPNSKPLKGATHGIRDTRNDATAEDFLAVRESVWNNSRAEADEGWVLGIDFGRGLCLGLDKSQAISTSAVPRSSPLEHTNLAIHLMPGKLTDLIRLQTWSASRARFLWFACKRVSSKILSIVRWWSRAKTGRDKSAMTMMTASVQGHPILFD